MIFVMKALQEELMQYEVVEELVEEEVGVANKHLEEDLR